MDNHSKLQALLGENNITDKEIDWDQYSRIKPKLYEGSDSDDDEMIVQRVNVAKGKSEVFEPQIKPISSMCGSL
jgi:hypothetical protein